MKVLKVSLEDHDKILSYLTKPLKSPMFDHYGCWVDVSCAKTYPPKDPIQFGVYRGTITLEDNDGYSYQYEIETPAQTSDITDVEVSAIKNRYLKMIKVWN